MIDFLARIFLWEWPVLKTNNSKNKELLDDTKVVEKEEEEEA
jgi:hypothetical protein